MEENIFFGYFLDDKEFLSLKNLNFSLKSYRLIKIINEIKEKKIDNDLGIKQIFDLLQFGQDDYNNIYSNKENLIRKIIEVFDKIVGDPFLSKNLGRNLENAIFLIKEGITNDLERHLVKLDKLGISINCRDYIFKNFYTDITDINKKKMLLKNILKNINEKNVKIFKKIVNPNVLKLKYEDLSFISKEFLEIDKLNKEILLFLYGKNLGKNNLRRFIISKFKFVKIIKVMEFKEIKNLKGWCPAEAESIFFKFCENLKSLKGSPKKVEIFDCSYNKNLKSLKYGPEEAKIFKCIGCNLKSLKGAPEKVNFFYCSSNYNLKDLSGMPKKMEKLVISESKFLKEKDIKQYIKDNNIEVNRLIIER